MNQLMFERVSATAFTRRFKELLTIVPRSSGDIEKIVPTRINPTSGVVDEYMFVYWKDEDERE